MGNIPAKRHHHIGELGLIGVNCKKMAEENKDVSMLDVRDASREEISTYEGTDTSLSHSLSQMNIDGAPELEARPPAVARRKSTLIFNDDEDEIPPYSQHQEHGTDDQADSGDERDNSGDGSNSSLNSVGDVRDSSVDETNKDSGARGSPAALERKGPEQDVQQRERSELRDLMVPVDITWQQGGEKVYVTGSFTGWRKMIGLVPVPGHPGLLHVKLQLPVGTHRFRFIVDNELRFSDYLPTATDQMGNFVNYLEVTAPSQVTKPPAGGQQPPAYSTKDKDTTTHPVSARSRIALEIEKEPDEIGNGFTRFREELPAKPSLEYTQDIPAVFTDPTVMEQYYLTLDQQQNNHQNMAWLTPPQLPPHLEDVPLNSYSSSQGDSNENNSGALPIPNHVVLNHLATSSIKHNTLCVASIVRYKRKYVTQILYAPLP
ncbi:hypothetical protein HG537_0D00830 [Torulaspora globosa]|uniref:Association with the SNF1 complex (ASC) domain-containing protein n=1 Tax=Torulaspora globosa TaxID=48254 RepID=A0A7H9HS20_9SACH|nr:hypothetical protein HG537_0D00830 [Torulaspora sp. CBS 2947]